MSSVAHALVWCLGAETQNWFVSSEAQSLHVYSYIPLGNGQHNHVDAERCSCP